MKLDLYDIRDLLDEDEARRFSERAALSRGAVRRRPDDTAQRDHRQNFAIDTDRILHSLSYTRYIDKTQVFYLVRNDHITHRVLHVQLVSRIARTIGRNLGLNEDLIEAIALGHDLGHAPFGHDGEQYLSRLCREAGIGHFLHAVQSVWCLEGIERRGRGLNLTLQVLDGILSHDGEVDNTELQPRPDLTFADLDRRMARKKADPHTSLTPMTAEGCVVRLSDTISYIGRDFEDAIRLGLVGREEMPKECATALGDTNGKIVYRLVTDLITTSRESSFVAFSREKAAALTALKNFNRERIYYNPKIKSEGAKIESLFRLLFERLLKDYETGTCSLPAFRDYIDDKEPAYLERLRPAEVVRDFLAGMTDEFFLSSCREMLLPEYRRGDFGRPL